MLAYIILVNMYRYVGEVVTFGLGRNIGRFTRDIHDSSYAFWNLDS